MPIHPRISPRIINSIATLYNDTNRIFMEYVDNAIDSADQHWLEEGGKSYSRPIEITVNITGSGFRNGEVRISDNCFGITNFTKVVESIGDSDKKAQGFTNGQFGFGIYSFMAACSDLELTSKEEDNPALQLTLNREQFDKKAVEDVSIPAPKEVRKFKYESGTKIRLHGFDRDSWKSVNAKSLKDEIERHFELILERENLSIRIIGPSGDEYRCYPFNYDDFDGEVYEDYIDHFDIESGRRHKVREVLKLDKPVHIFLKMTKGVVLNKPPVFVSKGRRICEIKDVRSFKSAHKSDIWGHASVTGYIDLKDLLGPTIARTDFKNDKNSRALFAELAQLEDLILDYVKRANEQSDERHYQQLEDALNRALSRLARVDAMNFRTSYLLGGDTNLAGNSAGAQFSEGIGAKDLSGDNSTSDGSGIGEGEGESTGTREGGVDTPGGMLEGEQAKNEQLFEDSEFKGTERKKSGFNIHISDSDPQIDAETGKPLRSLLSGEQIVLFKKHPDFQARLSHTRQGESKITQRLLAYIAGEITVHYKDEFYNKRQHGQPEYSKQMFVSMAEFIYQLEDDLSSLAGRNLAELT